ncbi:hypothetical protein BKI52_00225 [marine bacterium AO1-C]|nr:hypothetical protein BKI52_00225 [marine bacterium AO1-C]
MQTISYIGIGILGLFVFFILNKKHKQLNDYILALLNGLLALFLFFNVWVAESINAINFILQGIINLALIPVFLLYGLLSVAPKQVIRKQWWWIIADTLAFTAFIIIDFTLLTEYTPQKLEELYRTPPLIYHIFYKGHFLFVIVALLWFLKKINKYQQQIKSQYSFIDPIQLDWLKWVTQIYLANHSLSLVIFLLYNFNILFSNNIEIVYNILNGSIVIATFYTSYRGIKHYTAAELYQAQDKSVINNHKEEFQQEILTEKEEEKPLEKYQTSSLSDEVMQQLHQRLITLLEEERIYLEPKLQLQEVAQQLDVTTHVLSQTINTLSQKTFYHLINGYRVAHLKKMLQDKGQKQFTILALGLDSGFNSKASLNRIFKQYTGQTPREYQKTQVIQESLNP